MLRRESESPTSRIVRAGWWFCLSAVPLLIALAILATKDAPEQARVPVSRPTISEAAPARQHCTAVRFELAQVGAEGQ